jgi:hypothetical protein
MFKESLICFYELKTSKQSKRKKDLLVRIYLHKKRSNTCETPEFTF